MFNFSIIESIFQWLDADLLQIFGVKPWHVLFGLVFLLVTGCMWVIKPVLEWVLAKNWLILLSYINSLLIGFLFLQLIDRYAMGTEGSMLPHYFWSISLLAMSTYGACVVLVKSIRKVAAKIMKKNKNKVA
ncbi:hypothetical protein [Halobacillus seohaensis]|uniref:Uncharacterized protein n=1 Tax=Halobacillus seohaensis TaxID=447421 RepID=A0ABW2EKJ1_9BACI